MNKDDESRFSSQTRLKQCEARMASIADMSFALVVVLTSLITMACFMPPIWRKANVESGLNTRTAALRRLLVIGLGLYHANIVLFKDHGDSFMCPNSDNLNPDLFRWTTSTAFCMFVIIFIAAPLRILAVTTLGENFLGSLTPPENLVTVGVYRYIQHPGYTGQVMILTMNMAIIFRWDGALACWLPAFFLEDVSGLGFIICCVVIFMMVQSLPQHIRVEEALLQHAFGQKWEKWNKCTKRFVPGVI